MADVDLILSDGIPVGAPATAVPHRLFTVEEDMYLGCPVLNKTRAFIVPRGLQAILEWQIRDRQGNVIGLDGLLTNQNAAPPTPPEGEGQVIFRFDGTLGLGGTVHQIIGFASDIENGKVRVELTEALAETAGVYHMQVAITDSNGVTMRIDEGLLSIERGLFSRVENGISGPITIGELRLSLRDFTLENDLADDFEFSVAEIVHAIRRPVMEWNELPPNVCAYTTLNFPFHYYWLKAAVAELLMTAAHWYRRNRLDSSPSATVQDRNKDRDYLAVAREMREEWVEFIRLKKIEFNGALAVGSTD